MTIFPVYGDYINGVQPLPIPNREVKPVSADGTGVTPGRVCRRSLEKALRRASFYPYPLNFLLFPIHFPFLGGLRLSVGRSNGLGFPAACGAPKVASSTRPMAVLALCHSAQPATPLFLPPLWPFLSPSFPLFSLPTIPSFFHVSPSATLHFTEQYFGTGC